MEAKNEKPTFAEEPEKLPGCEQSIIRELAGNAHPIKNFFSSAVCGMMYSIVSALACFLRVRRVFDGI